MPVWVVGFAGVCGFADGRKGECAAPVAIVSVGRIAERPVVRDGQIASAWIGYVSVGFDHRVVDGARAAEFGLAVIRQLERAVD